MNSKELRELFPDANLTEKRLRDWANHGLISPTLGGFGYAGGAINNYPDDTPNRIKLILGVNEGQKRIDVKKTQYALIVNNFFLYGKNNGDELMRSMCEDIIDNIFTTIEDEEDKLRERYKNNFVKLLIFESFTAPITIYDKFFPVLQEAQIPCGESPFDLIRSKNDNGHYVIENYRYLGDENLSPIVRVGGLFNIYAIDRLIKEAVPGELENSFYNSTPLYNSALPIIGTLLGYDYGKIPDIEYFRDRLEVSNINMDKPAFEANLRIFTVFMYMALRKDLKKSNYKIDNFVRYGGLDKNEYIN